MRKDLLKEKGKTKARKVEKEVNQAIGHARNAAQTISPTETLVLNVEQQSQVVEVEEKVRNGSIRWSRRLVVLFACCTIGVRNICRMGIQFNLAWNGRAVSLGLTASSLW